MRDSIGTGIYFVTYESVKQILANARGTSPTHPLAVVIAGGLCGLVSWACVSTPSAPVSLRLLTLAQIFPIDTAKSIYQRNCLVGGKDKQTRPKIQFLNPRMYRGASQSSVLMPYRANLFQVWESPCLAPAWSMPFSLLHLSLPRSASTVWKSTKSFSIDTMRVLIDLYHARNLRFDCTCIGFGVVVRI